MFIEKVKTKAIGIKEGIGNRLTQGRWLFSLMSLLLLFVGNWETRAETFRIHNDPEIGLKMIVKAKVPREQIKLMAREQKSHPIKTESRPLEVNLTGKWEIEEEDRTYLATLDAKGNGPYTWQEGRIQTEKVVNRLWSGTWHQKGNDREGGFEVLLSEDGKTADGAWWYLRVGTHTNIPPRLEGGTYKMKRLSP